jgi:hypothetical protein
MMSFPVSITARTHIVWILVIAAPVIVAGCRRTAATDQANAAPGPDIVRISPSELFVNDLKRLEPHLGLTTGCYRVEAPDREMMFGDEWELWKDGKRVRRLDSGKVRVRKPDIASFSLKEVTGPKGERRFQYIFSISAKEGGGAATTSIEAPEPAFGIMASSEKLVGPRDLAANEKVLAWAYIIRDMKQSHGPTIEEALAKCRWALAVKIWWEPIKKGE